MTEPAKTREGEAMPDLAIDDVLIRFDGDHHAALVAALSDIAHLRRELQFASLAMSYGFARGWRPSILGR
ncbi:MAG: hypothetical protein K5872_15975 [Rhizobiaceae bacterium]|nr:hypothetical protein [Rhizobiaceae bacterium]MCV0407721.1 hypothetical protein [Rhizobiaceae bacterium]